MNRDIPGMINLETVIGQDRMYLKILLDKLMDQILPKYQKMKNKDSSFDYGGEGLKKITTTLNRFIDALGETFSDKYDKILKSEKNYELTEVINSMTKWAEERQVEALKFLVDEYGPDSDKKK